MLKRDIRIGDKTPSKISLGKDEPTSICLGDKLIWGGVDDTVDVTVYVDNPEVFNEENSYAVIIIGDKSVSIDRNHNGSFQFKTTLEDNRVVTNYLSHSSNLSDDVEIIVNGSVGAAYLGTVGFIYGFRIGNNEVHIKFKEVTKEEYVDATVYIDNPETLMEVFDFAVISIGDTDININANYDKKPFNIKAKLKYSRVELCYKEYSNNRNIPIEIDVNGFSYSFKDPNSCTMASNFKRNYNNIVHIKFKY